MLTLRHEAKLGKAVCGALVTLKNLNIIQTLHSLQLPLVKWKFGWNFVKIANSNFR